MAYNPKNTNPDTKALEAEKRQQAERERGIRQAAAELERIQAVAASDAEKIATEEARREKEAQEIAAREQKRIQDEMCRPLSGAEQQELARLERLANTPTVTVHRDDMLRLGRFRQRAAYQAEQKKAAKNTQ